MPASTAVDELLQSLSDVLFPAEEGERRVEIDSIGYDGDSPLHVLLWRNDERGVRLLVEAGANVNAKGEMDETPLHVALRQSNVALVQLLILAGARTDIRSEFGDTPADIAKQNGIDLQSIRQSPNITLQRTRGE